MNLKSLLSLFAFAVATPAAIAGDLDIQDGQWAITFNQSNNTLTYAQNGKVLLKNVFISALNKQEATLESKNYPNVVLTQEAYNDANGEGTKYTYTYSGLAGSENLEQSIYIYPSKNYLLVDAAVVAASGTTGSRYIAPIVCTTSNTFLPSTGQNYVYDMPHDNDNWVGYAAQPWSLGVSITSCEVSGFYDVTSREGLIVGSVEHDNWKSGITSTTGSSNRLRELTVAAGVVNKRTNDIWEGRPSISTHGTIYGKRVVSPKYFLGYYADWRNGLEDLGEATEKYCPKLAWDKGTIFSWQSWGGMADKVNYEGAMDVAEFFKTQMMPNHFVNENGTCYIVLDSFWDNFSEQQLRDFARYCKENGMHPGIYHTPFSYWGNEEQASQYRPYDGCPYTWEQISLKANGKLRKILSIALDPTHPGTIEYNKRKLAQFQDWGFEYVKLDFINNGTLEADSYYAEGITTGMQAYTYGMDRVIEACGDMFIDLSIAPVFPAKGHARRISCDAWGEMNNSQYVLNSLNLAWWLDRVYPYNDPDHLVISKSENEGAARVRYSCGAMTGTVLLGDNYSLKGSCLGNQAERDRALKVATNPDINAVARIGRSFRPIEGSLPYSFKRWDYTYGVDNEFVLDTSDAFYYVVMNYDFTNPLQKTATFERIGMDPANVKSIKELWTGQSVTFNTNGFDVSIPTSDVRFYRIDKVTPTAITETTKAESSVFNLRYTSGRLHMEAAGGVASLTIYATDGRLLAQSEFSGDNKKESIDLPVNEGLVLVKCVSADGRSEVRKVFLK